MRGLKYRLQRIKVTQTNKNLQTAETSQRWLGFRRFSDQANRLGATYFWKQPRCKYILTAEAALAAPAAEASVLISIFLSSFIFYFHMNFDFLIFFPVFKLNQGGLPPTSSSGAFIWSELGLMVGVRVDGRS